MIFLSTPSFNFVGLSLYTRESNAQILKEGSYVAEATLGLDILEGSNIGSKPHGAVLVDMDIKSENQVARDVYATHESIITLPLLLTCTFSLCESGGHASRSTVATFGIL